MLNFPHNVVHRVPLNNRSRELTDLVNSCSELELYSPSILDITVFGRVYKSPTGCKNMSSVQTDFKRDVLPVVYTAKITFICIENF